MRAPSCVAIAATLLLYSTLAAAHPALLASMPKADQTIDAPPPQIRLTFNEPVEVAFTTVKVVDASGKELLSPAVQRDPDDGNSIYVPLTRLPPGNYRALWSAAGRDGHRVKGELHFTVK